MNIFSFNPRNYEGMTTTKIENAIDKLQKKIEKAESKYGYNAGNCYKEQLQNYQLELNRRNRGIK